MAEILEQLRANFGLTGEQYAAVSERARNVVVTAGAGSGKTRTLVARYLGLLSEGAQPRQVVAITFTEKAAREMRSRARLALRQLITQAEPPAGRRRFDVPEGGQTWSALDAKMDSARIGTIHSLCAEILRAHPAEARLDPRFDVADENGAAALRAASVESALAWLIQQTEMGELVRAFSLGALRQLLAALLAKRLEVSPRSFEIAGLSSRVCQALRGFLQDDAVAGIRQELSQARAGGRMPVEAGTLLADQVAALLSGLESAQQALDGEDASSAGMALFALRRKQMRLNIGKAGRIKDAVSALRDRYDLLLQPWLGGASAQDAPPDAASEARLGELLPQLARLYAQALAVYRAALDEQSALDFDDLEGGTVALFQDPAIRARWQREVRAVLVDEFQDTNERQRQIILGLCGPQPGRLFVVGDARQSIYRFRGADVTVFTGLLDEIRGQGGLTLDLERTFRAHPALLSAAGALLAPVMGSDVDPLRPYHIPYSALRAERPAPRAGMQAPYVECLLAAAEDSQSARAAAARALARRLSELRDTQEIRSWDEVALLFRASTPFPIYEQALESCGIPFVTVAGSGFYERPEVRDLLNMLRALADPWDDQALAGLLRSPAFGVSDAGLYRLRVTGEGGVRPLFQALRGELSALGATDREHARRALEIVAELAPWVDRLPVAELLQRLVDRVDYRAALASAAQLPGSARLWRNVDKLIDDAQAGGQVRVSAFLETIATLRDIGAREGEAASEAEGAVRLMTIHKAKGLEFPVVVLADAARKPFGGREAAYRLGEAWTVAPDQAGVAPLAYRLAYSLDKQQAEAEEQRLLYVALTRAQEKLIVSGHLRPKDGRCTADGWLGQLLEAGGILPDSLLDEPGRWRDYALPGGVGWRIWLEPAEPEGGVALPAAPAGWPVLQAAPIYAPLTPQAAPAAPIPPLPGERTPAAGSRSVVEVAPRTPPARVVGEMVHKALQRWLFPGDPRLEPLLTAQAQMEGLLDAGLIHLALNEAEAMLRRFQRHALYAEMDAALERHAELPYAGISPQGGAEWGFMDCLYRTPAGWVLVDFKTDRLRDRLALDAAIERYRPQLQRYRQAAQRILATTPRAVMCFLNASGEIGLHEID